MQLITYVHMADGVLYHGTVSSLDGAPTATWTYELSGKKTTVTNLIEDDVFEQLWNAFSEQPVFEQHMVVSPHVPLDPLASHIISLVFRDQQGDGRCTFAIPAAEEETAFHRWLELLAVPRGA